MQNENEYKTLAEFYPTPPELAAKMVKGLEFCKIHTVLEPSAGKGDLISFFLKVQNYFVRSWSRKITDEQMENAVSYAMSENSLEWRTEVDVVELDDNLCAILKDKHSDYCLHNTDFLTYQDERHYDLILMNPPFSNGDEHLLKAISLAEKTGSTIVCLLNAETIRNPFTNKRKALLQQLDRYHAEYEYVQNAFSSGSSAERKTDVEVVVIRCHIPSPFTTTSHIWEELKDEDIQLEENGNYTEIIQADDELKAAALLYRRELAAGKRLIEEYLALKPYITSYFVDASSDSYMYDPTLQLVCKDGKELDWNRYVYLVRYKYWHQLLHKPSFLESLTSNLRDEYYSNIGKFARKDFSLSNIYSVKIDILKRTAQGIEEKIVSLFEEFSYRHSMGAAGNIHYFNGWKTNDAFKINKKIIIPYCDVWSEYSECYRYSYSLGTKLGDIEKVLNFLILDETNPLDYSSRNLDYWLQYYERTQQNRKLCFRHFDVDIFKKGTVHITFRDPELLKRFNLYGCQHKGWLPPSYGKKPYEMMTEEEQAVIDSYEGQEEYQRVYLNPNRYFLAPEKLLLSEGGSSV